MIALTAARQAPFDLRGVDLNLLVAFDALMTEGGVTAAATRMVVTQSTMSATLARLRKLFNDPVMVREGRSMRATPLADAMIEPVREILDNVQSLLATRSGFDPAIDRRTFRIMAGDYEATTVLHPLLATLAADAPNIQLRILPVEPGFTERLARHQIDLLIAPDEVLPRVGEYQREILYTDRHVLAVDERNPHVGAEITVEQFSAMPYIAAHFGHRPAFPEAHLDLLGITRNVEVTASFLLAPFLVRDTPLITLTSELLARRLAPTARLRLLEPPMPLPPLSVVMVWTKRVEEDPGHRWLHERIRTIAAQLGH